MFLEFIKQAHIFFSELSYVSKETLKNSVLNNSRHREKLQNSTDQFNWLSLSISCTTIAQLSKLRHVYWYNMVN